MCDIHFLHSTVKETDITYYAVALGSNRRHGRYGMPAQIILAAVAILENHKMHCVAQGPIITSAAIGPSLRQYANSAVIIATSLTPDMVLTVLKKIERDFGRRRGRRWGSRVLDLDIILWSGGIWASSTLAIPHPGFRNRDFVLSPLAQIAPDWRDPVTRLSIKQIFLRNKRKTPVDRRASRP